MKTYIKLLYVSAAFCLFAQGQAMEDKCLDNCQEKPLNDKATTTDYLTVIPKTILNLIANDLDEGDYLALICTSKNIGRKLEKREKILSFWRKENIKELKCASKYDESAKENLEKFRFTAEWEQVEKEEMEELRKKPQLDRLEQDRLNAYDHLQNNIKNILMNYPKLQVNFENFFPLIQAEVLINPINPQNYLIHQNQNNNNH